MAVILAKQDRPLVVSRAELEFVMHLTDLERLGGGAHGFVVIELSSVPGTFPSPGFGGKSSEDLSEDGVEILLQWIIDCRCKALGMALPRRAEGIVATGLFVPKWEIPLTI